MLSPEETHRLSEIAATGLAPMEEGRLICWERPAGQAPWLLWVTQITNGTPNTSYCAVAIYDTTANIEVDPAVLVTLFRLTKAEVRLAQQMMAGRTPVESAAEMGVTIHTVRTYLKRLYLKTGVRTQAALVRKLLHCAQTPYPRN